MRKTLLGKFVGVLLAFLAVGSMTLLQVDQSYAAAQMQTMRVKVVLSQAQLAMLAQQNHALYAQVIKAYRTGSPLVVTQHEYRVLGRLTAAYLGSAKAGQPAPGAPGSPQNPISVGKTPTFQVPTSGPLVPWIQGMAQQRPTLPLAVPCFRLWRPHRPSCWASNWC
jgi:predicted lipid-binding transport protein (Tim44 family)